MPHFAKFASVNNGICRVWCGIQVISGLSISRVFASVCVCVFIVSSVELLELVVHPNAWNVDALSTMAVVAHSMP